MTRLGKNMFIVLWLLGCQGGVDDTPVDVDWVPRQDLVAAARAHLEATGSMPGKGARLLRELADDPTVEVLWHGYNVLFRIRA